VPLLQVIAKQKTISLVLKIIGTKILKQLKTDFKNKVLHKQDKKLG